MLLQWGHRLSAMETSRIGGDGNLLASPLQWGHRLSAMETVNRTIRLSTT